MKNTDKKKFKENFAIESSILELVNKFFWKSKIGPIGALVMPISFMLIYKIMSYLNGHENIYIFTSGLSSYLTLSIVPIAIITLPQIIVELKNSILLRKISISRVSALNFSCLLIGYIIIAQICSTLITILVYAICLNVDAPKQFRTINWWNMLFAMFATALASLSFGYMCGVFIKKPTLPPLLGFIVLLISATLGGQFVPIHVIAQSEACRIVTLFSPLTYPINLFNNVCMEKPPLSEFTQKLMEEGYNQDIINKLLVPITEQYNNLDPGANIFDIYRPAKIFKFDSSAFIRSNASNKIRFFSTIVVYPTWQKVLNLVMPFALSIIFFVWPLKKFNWTSR